MSNLTLKGNASGSGTFTLESPNSNTSRTLTLPDQTDTLMGTTTPVTQAQLETSLNVSGSAPMFACRAFVCFDGTRDTTGTTSTANTNRLIKAGGNVASVLRNATGDYTITFSTALPDANYGISGFSTGVSASNITGACLIVLQGSAVAYVPNLKTASQFRIQVGNTNGVLADPQEISIMVFR